MDERKAIERWARQWAAAAPELEAIRREEIRTADNQKVLTVLEPAFNQALRAQPMRESSGMVEMQRVLAKLRG
ncbi:MAG: hypothetical protein ABI972_06940 [Acidobacteriota bacterium]